MQSNLRTTIAAWVGVLAWIFAAYGLDLPAGVQESVIIATVGVVAYFAADRDVRTTSQASVSAGLGIIFWIFSLWGLNLPPDKRQLIILGTLGLVAYFAKDHTANVPNPPVQPEQVAKEQ